MPLDTQKRTDPNMHAAYPKKSARVSKHVCLKINLQKNAVIEQNFANLQDYSKHSMQLPLQ